MIATNKTAFNLFIVLNVIKKEPIMQRYSFLLRQLFLIVLAGFLVFLVISIFYSIINQNINKKSVSEDKFCLLIALPATETEDKISIAIRDSKDNYTSGKADIESLILQVPVNPLIDNGTLITISDTNMKKWFLLLMRNHDVIAKMTIDNKEVKELIIYKIK